MEQKTITLHNGLGLHARPASLFVQTANRFPADIRVEKDGREVSAKGILGLLSLGAKQGSTITIKAVGEQEAEAVTALADLVEFGFDESAVG